MTITTNYSQAVAPEAPDSHTAPERRPSQRNPAEEYLKSFSAEATGLLSGPFFPTNGGGATIDYQPAIAIPDEAKKSFSNLSSSAASLGFCLDGHQTALLESAPVIASSLSASAELSATNDCSRYIFQLSSSNFESTQERSHRALTRGVPQADPLSDDVVDFNSWMTYDSTLGYSDVGSHLSRSFKLKFDMERFSRPESPHLSLTNSSSFVDPALYQFYQASASSLRSSLEAEAAQAAQKSFQEQAQTLPLNNITNANAGEELTAAMSVPMSNESPTADMYMNMPVQVKKQPQQSHNNKKRAYQTSESSESSVSTDSDAEMDSSDDDEWDESADTSKRSSITRQHRSSGRRSKEKQHKCQVAGCGKEYRHSSSLRDHMNSHSVVKRPYACTFEGCVWAFSERSNLQRHLRSHQGVKRFVCPMCQHAFAQKSNMLTHIDRLHQSKPARRQQKRQRATPASS